jgi:hypothetical protein
MSESENKGKHTLQIWGWALFALCSILFAASGIRNGDFLAAAGSILFLAGCLLFIVSLRAGPGASETEQKEK